MFEGAGNQRVRASNGFQLRQRLGVVLEDFEYLVRCLYGHRRITPVDAPVAIQATSRPPIA